MTSTEFDQLCEAALTGDATKEQLRALVEYTRDLRVEHIYSINQNDDWDKEQLLLDYEPYRDLYGEEEGENTIQIREWAKKHAWMRTMRLVDRGQQ